MAGRPRKPLLLHAIHGTARKDRHAKRGDELQITGEPLGDPPDFLAAEAAEEWIRLTNHAEYKQVLGSIHRSALIEYCTLHGRMIEDVRGGKEFGSTQRQVLSSLRMQLGLTPASQSKVKFPEKPKQGNPWAEVG